MCSQNRSVTHVAKRVHEKGPLSTYQLLSFNSPPIHLHQNNKQSIGEGATIRKNLCVIQPEGADSIGWSVLMNAD